MSFYGTGLKRSTPSKVAHRLRAEDHPEIAAALAAGPKGSGDLRACLPATVFDQGQSGTCFAHSFAACAYGAQAQAGKPLAFVPSPLFVASCTYSDVRKAATPDNAPLPVLTDTGAELQDAANAGARWGVAPLGKLEGGRYSDVPGDPPNNVFPEPDYQQALLAGSDIVTGEYSITSNAEAPKVAAASLDAGYLLWVGFFCDSAFQALKPGDVAQAPDQNDPQGGGHAVLLCGYRTAADGSFEFLLRNSWGAGWCDGGYCWVSTAWLVAAWDCWPFTAKVGQ
jgi:hypothetical protein